MALSFFLLGCVDKHIAIPMKCTTKLDLIPLPESIQWAIEPIGMTDVLHDANATQATVYRDLSKTNLGSHSYKNASLMDSEVVYNIYDYYNYLFTLASDWNEKANRENNTTLK